MKHLITILVFAVIFSTSVFSQSIDIVKAEIAANTKLNSAGTEGKYNIRNHILYLDAKGSGLFFLFSLEPKGYIIIPGKMELPPVLAYSFTDDPDPEGRFVSLVQADLTFRVKNQTLDVIERNRMAWNNIPEHLSKAPLFQQWPEPGTTTSEGWVETNWTQSSPYNQLCPMDLVTGSRSIAGCPAVAMAQIVNFHRTLNGVHFSDNDDYHHNYAGRNYMIDDDYITVDFPSFPMLNYYLDTLQTNYDSGTPLDNRDKAALTFACGVAARQVYTSSASGTFGVDQALDAYLKFNFEEVELLEEDDTNLYSRMAQNIKDTLPVHLAVVDSAWSMGHNVVVDGYNTDEYFHLNFGWGGSSNGWYLLPEEFPYGLTVVEGVIVDIIPDHPTGIAEKDNQPALFYPNPARDIVYFSANKSGFTKAEIYSPDGRLCRTINLEQTGMSLDISDFPEGIYFIRMHAGNNETSGKLLIHR